MAPGSALPFCRLAFQRGGPPGFAYLLERGGGKPWTICFKTVHSMGPAVKASKIDLFKFSLQRATPCGPAPSNSHEDSSSPALVPLLVEGLGRKENREPLGFWGTGDSFSSISSVTSCIPSSMPASCLSARLNAPFFLLYRLSLLPPSLLFPPLPCPLLFSLSLFFSFSVSLSPCFNFCSNYCSISV